MKMIQAESIDEYISSFPKDIQKLLKQMRATIKKAAPKAVEAISYGMPTFRQEGNLVHFAAYKSHIGFYPAPRALEVFKKELSKYEGSKGTLKLPLDEPLPLSIITKIVKFRVKENLEKANAKKLVKKGKKK